MAIFHSMFEGRLMSGAHCIKSSYIIMEEPTNLCSSGLFAFRFDIILAICQIWHGSLEKWRRMFELIARLLPVHLCDSKINKWH